MPQFKYEVKRSPGVTATGVLDAESQRAAVARLRDMGYFPTSVELHTDQKNDSLKHSFRRIRLADRNIFFRQLADLLESGMPLARALSTLVEQSENPKMVGVVKQLREEVQKGISFAEALEQHPKIFSPMLVNMIRAGETGGMLEAVLWRIVTFGEQEEELRGKAISALIYPIFLLSVGTVAIFILVSFVFPKFITIFNDFNAVLPFPTRVVMSVCGFMGSFWWAVLLGAATITAAIVSYMKTPAGRRQRDRLLLSIPVVRDLIQRYEMAKFARTLGTLLDNGVPVLTSLKVTADTLSNVLIADDVSGLHARITDGDSISDSLRQARHFPAMVINMFAVGEESGRLGQVTARIADAYDAQVDRAVKAIAALFEPILIVVMGIIIGFLVIAMLLPMLTLSANIK